MLVFNLVWKCITFYGTTTVVVIIITTVAVAVVIITAVAVFFFRGFLQIYQFPFDVDPQLIQFRSKCSTNIVSKTKYHLKQQKIPV